MHTHQCKSKDRHALCQHKAVVAGEKQSARIDVDGVLRPPAHQLASSVSVADAMPSSTLGVATGGALVATAWFHPQHVQPAREDTTDATRAVLIMAGHGSDCRVSARNPMRKVIAKDMLVRCVRECGVDGRRVGLEEGAHPIPATPSRP